MKVVKKMNYKKSIRYLILVFAILIAITVTNAAYYYKPVDIRFEGALTDSVAYHSAICLDSECTKTEIDSNQKFYYGQQAISCYKNNLNSISKFEKCVSEYEITNHIIKKDLAKYDNNGKQGYAIVVKYDDSNSNNGYISHFFSSDDQHIPKYDIFKGFSCNDGNSCFDLNNVNKFTLDKIQEAKAEISSFEVLNVEDKNLPIQINVKAEMSPTVCSAYISTNGDLYYPGNPKNGYSDDMSKTKISLNVKNVATGNIIKEFSDKVVDIKMDDCSLVTSFEWVPSSDLENTEVLFTLTTDVIDNQVVKSIPDVETHQTTIYPQELNDDCWAIIQNFTLSNKNSLNVNSELSQVEVGEDVYALFNLGAFFGEFSTPINYDYKLSVNNEEIVNLEAVTNLDGTLSLHSVDLTNKFEELGVGNYLVSLFVKAKGDMCTGINAAVIKNKYLDVIEEKNTPPSIDLPEKFTEYIRNTIEINLKDYISDREDSFENLKVSFEILSGKYTAKIEDGILKVDSSILTSGSLKVIVEDTQKLKSEDIVLIEFIQGNSGEIFVDFSATPIYDVDELETVFSVNIKGFEEDKICELNFGDNEKIEACNGLNGLKHTYEDLGKYTAKLIVKDDLRIVEKTVDLVVNDKPTGTFVADKVVGENNLTVQFNKNIVDVIFLDSKTCEIDFGDGNKENCLDENIFSHKFGIGDFFVKISYDDGYGEIFEKTLIITVTENNKPTIQEFSANPTTGYEILKVDFKVKVVDDGSELICKIDFGNGKVEEVDCNLDNLIEQNYTAGVYLAKLIVNDGLNEVVSEPITITVNENLGPIIEKFEIIETSLELPTNLTINYNASHLSGFEISCLLFVNGQTNVLDSCNGVFEIRDFNLVGPNTFVFKVVDEFGKTVNSTIIKSFKYDNFGLLINEEQNVGDFDFKITVDNEMVSRNFVVKPQIICNGIISNLTINNGYLKKGFKTVSSNEIKSYTLESSSYNYAPSIPEDVLCTFRANLENVDTGNVYTLESPVKFTFNLNPYNNGKIPSITGREGDLRKVMSNMFQNLEPGYNLVHFNVVNNENYEKEFSITMTGRTLGLFHKKTITIKPEETKQIELMIFVDDNAEKGRHAVKYSANNGNDKISQYGYVTIV